jgi:hypothetical protein
MTEGKRGPKDESRNFAGQPGAGTDDGPPRTCHTRREAKWFEIEQPGEIAGAGREKRDGRPTNMRDYSILLFSYQYESLLTISIRMKKLEFERKQIPRSPERIYGCTQTLPGDLGMTMGG